MDNVTKTRQSKLKASPWRQEEIPGLHDYIEMLQSQTSYCLQSEDGVWGSGYCWGGNGTYHLHHHPHMCVPIWFCKTFCNESLQEDSHGINS